jgi:hypothetical protein
MHLIRGFLMPNSLFLIKILRGPKTKTNER